MSAAAVRTNRSAACRRFGKERNTPAPTSFDRRRARPARESRATSSATRRLANAPPCRGGETHARLVAEAIQAFAEPLEIARSAAGSSSSNTSRRKPRGRLARHRRQTRETPLARPRPTARARRAASISTNRQSAGSSSRRSSGESGSPLQLARLDQQPAMRESRRCRSPSARPLPASAASYAAFAAARDPQPRMQRRGHEPAPIACRSPGRRAVGRAHARSRSGSPAARSRSNELATTRPTTATRARPAARRLRIARLAVDPQPQSGLVDHRPDAAELPRAAARQTRTCRSAVGWERQPRRR